MGHPMTRRVVALLATLTLAILPVINCLGVRSGNNTQTALMLFKLAASTFNTAMSEASSEPTTRATRLRFSSSVTVILSAFATT